MRHMNHGFLEGSPLCDRFGSPSAVALYGSMHSCELAARPAAMPQDRRLATWNDLGRYRLHCSNRNKVSSARLARLTPPSFKRPQ
jgi:hypothetical protein